MNHLFTWATQEASGDTHDNEVTCVQVFAGLVPWNTDEVNKMLSQTGILYACFSLGEIYYYYTIIIKSKIILHC